MAKQERRIFDKEVQVWIHRYKNLCNMAHWHFENELVVCQEGSADIMLDGNFYNCRGENVPFFAVRVFIVFEVRLTVLLQWHSLERCFILLVI